MDEGIILGAGNPLLDVIVKVDKIFLNRWSLKENNSTPCIDELEGIFDEIENLFPQHIPGGTVQNTAVVLQWILKQPRLFTVLGVIGDDLSGRELLEKMVSNGANVQYETSFLAPTGKCAVLINGHNRSMCTNLGASRHFSSSFWRSSQILSWVDRARFFYFSSFFFNASEEFLMFIGDHCLKENKTFCLNLASPLAQRRFSAKIEALLPFVDVIFGNQDEVKAFGEAHQIKGDYKEIAKFIANSPKRTSPSRIVVITQAAEAIFAIQDKVTVEVPVPYLDDNKIADTDGAGDAFVGGFLSQFIQQKSLEICIKCGNYAASEIIQRAGCTPPEYCNWKE